MVKDIAYSAYPAKDVPALRKFYEDALGIKFGEPFVQDGVEKYAEAQVGNSWFAVMTTDWLETIPSGGISFEVDDIRATIDRVRQQRGGSEFEDVHDIPSCFISSFRDPEGNKVTLHQSKGAAV
mgnify:CR=1 FL=1